MIGLLKRLRSRAAVPFCAAVIAAAGSSTRMGGENKLLLPLGGVPVIVRTLLAVDHAQSVCEIVIAAREDELLTFAELCRTYGITKPVKIIPGGETRTESVLRAVGEVDPHAELIAVQDGARPFTTPELIDRVAGKARVCRAAAPAVPVHDTIKVARDGIVRDTPERSTLFAVQTPQIFDAQLLRAALQSATEKKLPITDDCSAVEALGKEIYLTDGDEENIKITTPTDLLFAEAILAKREGS